MLLFKVAVVVVATVSNTCNAINLNLHGGCQSGEVVDRVESKVSSARSSNGGGSSARSAGGRGSRRRFFGGNPNRILPRHPSVQGLASIREVDEGYHCQQTGETEEDSPFSRPSDALLRSSRGSDDSDVFSPHSARASDELLIDIPVPVPEALAVGCPFPSEPEHHHVEDDPS